MSEQRNIGAASPASGSRIPRDWLKQAGSYGAGVAIVAAVTAAGMLLLGTLSHANIALFYLLPVMIVSTRAGLGPGLFTSAIAALAFNFFLVPPRFTFWIHGPDHFVTMLVLFAVALVTSQLAWRLRSELVRAEASARANAELAAFTRLMLEAEDEPSVIRRTVAGIASLFDAQVALLLEGDDGLLTAFAEPAGPPFGAIDNAAAAWAHHNGDTTGRGTGIMTSADWMFAPLIAGGRRLGLLAVARDDAGLPIAADRRPLFDGVVEQAAQALGRMRLAAEQAEIERLQQRDELRTAVLSSIGHDLRTPLTVILAGLEELRLAKGDPATLAQVHAEARRLERLVGNLLEMARLEAGAIRLACEPVDLTDAVAAAAEDMRASLQDRRLDIEVPIDLPLLSADPRLLHHILINLIDNAGKYGLPDRPIAIRAALEADALRLEVVDEGPGIPPGQEESIFDRFARLQGSDRVGGAGLGLAIVRGFASAMAVDVSAANRQDGKGSVFALRFPASLFVTARMRLPA